jgi:hypothetical protein
MFYRKKKRGGGDVFVTYQPRMFMFDVHVHVEKIFSCAEVSEVYICCSNTKAPPNETDYGSVSAERGRRP